MSDLDDTQKRIRLRRLAEQTTMEVLQRVNELQLRFDDHVRQESDVVEEQRSYERRSDEYRREMVDRIKAVEEDQRSLSTAMITTRTQLQTITRILFAIFTMCLTITGGITLMVIKHWAKL